MYTIQRKQRSTTKGLRSRFSAVAVALASAVVIPFASSGGAQAATIINEYPIPTAESAPTEIAAGPDGNMWFAESAKGKIAKITPSGQITEYVVTTGNSQITGITAGPDGNMWFADGWGYVGKITMNGEVTRWTTALERSPVDITTGSDGNLWFTMWAGYIGKITPEGVITEYSVRQGSNSTQPRSITAGPDGALWVTHSTDPARISRVATDGTITPMIITNTDADTPYDIVTGPDGALWYTNTGDSALGRMATDGSVTAFPYPNNQPWTAGTRGITVGADGALWFADPMPGANRIHRITTSGAATSFNTPTTNATPLGIATGPTGAIWFTETYYMANKIGRLIVDSTRPTVTFTAPTSFAGPFATGPTVTVAASDTNDLSSMVIHVYTSENTLLNVCGTATPAELAAGSKSCDLSGLPAGSYYIKAGANDIAGNNRTINSGAFTIGS
jgi:virginiamycin B lyase